MGVEVILRREKVRVERLPVTEAFLPRKRLVQDRGELALIEDGMTIRHLAYLSLLPGEGRYRGGHYHEKKTECFYVIRGVVRIETVDLDTSRREVIEVRQGEVLRIRPRLAHRFRAIEQAELIEYYDTVFDARDDHPFPDFQE